jgi:cytochrome c oxidase assembly protein subunit 15
VHGAIEFGNRVLTWVLLGIILATVVAAVRARAQRPGLWKLTVALLLYVPLQAVIGAVTVLTHLNPWVVMLHFLASMPLIGLSVLLVRRTREGDAPPRLVVPRMLRTLAVAQLAVLGVVLYLGTVVTASGPHAGDRTARRTGLDLESVAQAHVDAVMLLLGLSVGLLVALRAVGAPQRATRAAAVFVGVEVLQGVVGFAQYFSDLPVLLVGLHMLGAALLAAAGTDVVLACRVRAGVAGPLPAPRTGEVLRA